MGMLDTHSGIADALYPRTRQAVLGLFFTHPGERYLQTDVIRRLGLGSGAVQRELERLSDAEILFRVKDGRQIYFGANQKSPIFAELRGIVQKTFGLTDVLRDALARLRPSIDVAFVFGSVASGKETSASDVDLMVISNQLSLSDLLDVTSNVQRQLGREVNPTIYRPNEFREKLTQGHHFLSSVMKTPKLFVIGDEVELRRLAEKRMALSAPDAAKRDPRSGRNRRP